MSDNKKIQFLLPNIFTALNMSCGFIAILFAIKGDFSKSLYLIIIGSVFDLFDGRVARWTGTQSSFGEQFDSLSDLISFGLAPAIIFYLSFLSDYGRRGIICALIFCLCGSLRLARFNVNVDKAPSNYFEGLPIPGAALALIGYTFFSHTYKGYIPNFFGLIYIFVYSLFMVSTIPFFSFKELGVHKKKAFLLMIFVIATIFMNEEVFIFFFINLYVFVSLIYFLLNRNKFKKGLIEIED